MRLMFFNSQPSSSLHTFVRRAPEHYRSTCSQGVRACCHTWFSVTADACVTLAGLPTAISQGIDRHALTAHREHPTRLYLARSCSATGKSGHSGTWRNAPYWTGVSKRAPNSRRHWPHRGTNVGESLGPASATGNHARSSPCHRASDLNTLQFHLAAALTRLSRSMSRGLSDTASRLCRQTPKYLMQTHVLRAHPQPSSACMDDLLRRT